mgnify:CR=1 FL=1
MLRHLLSIARIKKLKKVCLLVNTDNDRVVHLYKKVGFEIEGKLSRERYFDGKFGDEYRMAIFLVNDTRTQNLQVYNLFQ